MLGYENNCLDNVIGNYKTRQTYSYDNLYQLIKVEGETTYDPYHSELPEFVSNYSQNFEFDTDGLGNMTSKVSKESVSPLKKIGDNLNYNFTYVYDENFAHRLVRAGDRYYKYDSNGKIVWHADYEAFGNIMNERGEENFTPNYTGKFFDESSGLYYFNARWYDCELGRFTTQDLARDGMNWWIYCESNPLIYTDPDGRCSVASLFLSIKFAVKVYKEVSTMPSQSEHYSRNNSNVDIGTDWNSANKLAEQGQVIRMSEGKDSYHEQGTATGYDPGMNDKFVSLDGKNETVYNKETGQKITDPVNQGTYNRADPNKDPIGHFFQDMIPYYVWGNSEDDPTTAWERITGSYQGNVNATKEEASQFRAQMNEENRNKAMEQYYEHH